MNLFETLKELTAAAGVAGEENSAAFTVKKMLDEYGKAEITPYGNVLCRVGEFSQNKPTILLDAHIDEIGMIVSYITDDGFLKVSNCGGLDRRVLLAQQVTIYGKQKLTGFVTSTPPHLEKGNSAVPEIDDIYIDTGLSGEQARSLVNLGDKVLIENALEKMQGSRVTSKALDDRCGCAAILLVLDLIRDKKLDCNIIVLFSTQEETGERGAQTGAYDLNADMAVVVDVSFAKTNGEADEDCGRLGKGAMIGFAPSLSRKMSNDFVSLAEKENIPYQLEVMNGKTGTNADAIGVTQNGIACVTISIPEKHMHTPVEIVDLKDIENTAKLIAKYLESVGK